MLYPVPDADNLFRKGTIAMFVVAGLLAACICAVWWLERWVVQRVPRPATPSSPGVPEIEVGEGEKESASLAKV